MVYKGVCFKRSKLNGNSDKSPPDCNVYNPRASWQESDYVALQRMFKDRPTWEQINRNSKGGLCTNFRATLVFEQHNVSHAPHNTSIKLARSSFNQNACAPQVCAVQDHGQFVSNVCLNVFLCS